MGLTGSIAMGKSHAARILRSLGLPVFDSDLQVHFLYRDDRHVQGRIAQRFPQALTSVGVIDRRKLAQIVFGNKRSRFDLEKILHPQVVHTQRRFLRHASRCQYEIAVIDVPLLFETSAEKRVDAALVVGANSVIQRDRALRRRHMDAAKFRLIKDSQLASYEKRRRADFFVPSGLDRGQMTSRVISILTEMEARSANAWPKAWCRNL
ncbi:MAG: dephospho-CoA kinase [Pseudomonadota bacterium]